MWPKGKPRGMSPTNTLYEKYTGIPCTPKKTTVKSKHKLTINNKGLSPLVATLLLIAIAVAASVITYSWVMTMIGFQSVRAQTQIRVNTAHFFRMGYPNGTQIKYLNCEIRNTGSLPAIIDMISIREKPLGSIWNSTKYEVEIKVGNSENFNVPFNWIVEKEYILRATCTTGFYYEMAVNT